MTITTTITLDSCTTPELGGVKYTQKTDGENPHTTYRENYADALDLIMHTIDDNRVVTIINNMHAI